MNELHSALLSLRPPVFIVPHMSADIDAVASAVGVQSFLNAHNVPSILLFPSLSAPAAKLLKDFAVNYSSKGATSGKDVVVVDTSSSAMLPLRLDTARRVLVVDHHHGGDLEGYVFETPSLSEVVAELLLEDGVRDRRAYALLATGIYSDTARLLAAQPSTLITLGRVLKLASMSLGDVMRLTSQKPSISERVARLKALKRVEIHRFGEFIVATAKSGAHEGSVAWFFVLAGADIAFVAGKGRVIARASDDFMIKTGIDLNDIFSAVSEKITVQWGGHPGAAGMRVKDANSALSTILSELGTLLRARGFHFIRVDH